MIIFAEIFAPKTNIHVSQKDRKLKFDYILAVGRLP